MTINHIQRLYDYNDWAWQQVFPSLAQLDDATYKLDRGFFWGSLHSLMVHSMSAEYIWTQRIMGTSPRAMLDPADYATFPVVQAQWTEIDGKLRQLVATLADQDLERPIAYTDRSGQPFSTQLGDILLHVVNHATEHRSQMTPVLFALNVATPPLDYIFFTRA
ncbi:MAG: DinB family protein [Caldilineaceae bacterium]|nr:DinB family protein [Caldilineaceae bacterium]